MFVRMNVVPLVFHPSTFIMTHALLLNFILFEVTMTIQCLIKVSFYHHFFFHVWCQAIFLLQKTVTGSQGNWKKPLIPFYLILLGAKKRMPREHHCKNASADRNHISPEQFWKICQPWIWPQFSVMEWMNYQTQWLTPCKWSWIRFIHFHAHLNHCGAVWFITTCGNNNWWTPSQRVQDLPREGQQLLSWKHAISATSRDHPLENSTCLWALILDKKNWETNLVWTGFTKPNNTFWWLFARPSVFDPHPHLRRETKWTRQISLHLLGGFYVNQQGAVAKSEPHIWEWNR